MPRWEWGYWPPYLLMIAGTFAAMVTLILVIEQANGIPMADALPFAAAVLVGSLVMASAALLRIRSRTRARNAIVASGQWQPVLAALAPCPTRGERFSESWVMEVIEFIALFSGHSGGNYGPPRSAIRLGSGPGYEYFYTRVPRSAPSRDLSVPAEALVVGQGDQRVLRTPAGTVLRLTRMPDTDRGRAEKAFAAVTGGVSPSAPVSAP